MIVSVLVGCLMGCLPLSSQLMLLDWPRCGWPQAAAQRPLAALLRLCGMEEIGKVYLWARTAGQLAHCSWLLMAACHSPCLLLCQLLVAASGNAKLQLACRCVVCTSTRSPSFTCTA
jgi:hypothetical protein